MTVRAAALVVMVLAGAMPAGIPPSSTQTVRCAAGQSALRIPFELFANLVLVQVSVNGSKPLRFILDTGADTSVIDAQRAKALGLTLQGTIAGTGGAGTAEAAIANGVTVGLPGVDLRNRTIYVLPLASLSAIGRDIDGVLGNDILKEFVVEIDYGGTTVGLHEPGAYRYAGASEPLSVSLENGLLFVRGSVVLPGRPAIDARFEIDSGSTSAAMLNTPFVNSHKVLASVSRTVPTRVGGVGGAAAMRVGRVNSISLGRVVIERPITRFSRATRGDYASATYDGLIGGEILRRFKVVVDFSRHQMMLEPNAHFGESFEIDMSGLTLVPDGSDILVDDVEPHSVGAVAGVRGGDIVMAVNGQPASEVGLDQIRVLLMQDGKECVFNLRRNGKTVQARLKLKRVI